MPEYAVGLAWTYVCAPPSSVPRPPDEPVEDEFFFAPQGIESALVSEFALLSDLQTVGEPFMFKGFSAIGAPRIASDVCQPVDLKFDGGASSKFTRTAGRYQLHLPLLQAGMFPVVYRFNTTSKSWTPMPSQGEGTVCLTEAGIYQVFAQRAGGKSAFGEVYVYPNPTRSGQSGTLHIELPQMDKVTVRIYDVAGELVYSADDFTRPQVINGRSSYERPLESSHFKAGVYLGVVTAQKAGQDEIRHKFRFSVLR